MIRRFTIRNYKSIFDLCVDFSFAEGKAPNGYRELEQLVFCESKKGRRIVPCLALYGANASGKSNIIMALQALVAIASAQPVQFLYSPNKLEMPNDPTTFILEMDVRGKLLNYTISYTRSRIVEESLYADGIQLYDINDGIVFFDGITAALEYKTYTAERLREIFLTECMESGIQRFPLLHRFANNYPGLNGDVQDAYGAIQRIITPSGNHLPLSLGLDLLANNQDLDEIDTALNRVAKILRTLDIDISRMSINRTFLTPEKTLPFRPGATIVSKGDIQYADYVRSYHKNTHGHEVEFNFSTEESFGTQVAAGLIGVCLSALDSGGVLVVDEMDRSLHPFVFKEIVSLFKDKRYNKNNAQLFLTAHNTDLLDTDILRVSEVGIVNKTCKSGTTLRRISDYSGVRNVTNFRKQYLSGCFAGIPHPYV